MSFVAYSWWWWRLLLLLSNWVDNYSLSSSRCEIAFVNFSVFLLLFCLLLSLTRAQHDSVWFWFYLARKAPINPYQMRYETSGWGWRRWWTSKMYLHNRSIMLVRLLLRLGERENETPWACVALVNVSRPCECSFNKWKVSTHRVRERGEEGEDIFLESVSRISSNAHIRCHNGAARFVSLHSSQNTVIRLKLETRATRRIKHEGHIIASICC